MGQREQETSFTLSPEQQRASGALENIGNETLGALRALPAWEGRTSAAFDPASFRGFDTLRTAGNNALRANAGQGVRDLAGRTLRGDFLDVGSNPALQGLIQSSINPMQRNFAENVLPAITAGASGSGAFDNIRRNIVTEQAGGRLNEQIGNLTNQILGQNYMRERQNQMFAPQMFQQASALDAMPAEMFMREGEGRRAAAQNEITDAMGQRGMRQQDAVRLLQALAPFQNILGGPGGTQTTTMTPSVMDMIGSGMQGISGLMGGVTGLVDVFR
jgi:hypothetical protein